MAIKEIFRRVFGMRDAEHPGFKKITPDEMELNSYLEEERKKRIKKRLAYYRYQRYKEMFGPASLMKKAPSILRGKQVFK
jgi:hypothetical protein